MLHVHRASRADHLVSALARVLAPPLDDPLDADVVAVHSRGIERWLAQQLALRLGASDGHHDGICANVEFVFRRRLIDQPLALAAGGTAAAIDPREPDADPWSPSRLVWRLLELLDERPAGVSLGPLDDHLGEDGDARFGAAFRVVDLFDRYAVHRPSMLLDWQEGRLVDASGEPLSPDHRWQAELWRAVRERVAVPSRPERHLVAVERLRRGVLDLDLPRRLSLFNLTALAVSDLELLQAMGEHRDVHVFLLHASPVLWERIARAPIGGQVPRREDDPTRGIAEHPLLASWGRDTREVQVVLTAAGAREASVHADGTEDDPTGAAATLLARLQADLRADRRPPGAPIGDASDGRAVLADADRSVQVHSCHGRTRQVEVLRDAIGHLLAADPDLEPRDIVVLCPEVEQFAPLVHAVFGADAVTEQRGEGELPQLRVRIADRALREANPLLEVVAGLLELVHSRAEASRVLDLAGREPVRRRFHLDDDDLAQLERWADDVGVRWGFDGAHRAAHDLEGIAANTWQAGLDRLLVGIAVPDDDLAMFGGVVPHDVEGQDVDRAGRLAELVARLQLSCDELGHAQPIAAWCAAIRGAVERLTAVADRDAWQRQQLERELSDIEQAATDPDGEVSSVPLALGEVRTLLGDRLSGRPSRANHRTGDLTVCTLVPMRSVPHQVVCLLGMDDAAFPRTVQADGDSLIDLDPRVGDRDPRTEDRQLLLDAVLSARRSLVVTYTGHDERTNEPAPPAVPIGELLDAIDATVVASDGGRARDRIVVEHPLQGFDPRNFVPDELVGPGPWRFERTDLAGARALRAPRPPIAPFVPDPLEPLDEPLVALDDLIAFLQHPVRAFLGRRLGVRVPRDQEEREDAIPVDASPLLRYQVGDSRLAAALRGLDRHRWEQVERGRGTLPPGRLADPVLADVEETVAALLAAAVDRGAIDIRPGDAAAGRSVEVDVELDGGRSLVGTIRGVHGDTVTALRYARLGSRHHVEAYAQLVALTATDPQRPWTAVAVGRNKNSRAKAKAGWCRLGPLGETPAEREAAAREALSVLMDLYDRGMTEPLPLYCDTSAEYAAAMASSKPNRFKAAKTWDDEYGFPENAQPEHVLVLGPAATYESLLLAPPNDLECGPGWSEAASRFEALALRLWEPIMACREEGTT